MIIFYILCPIPLVIERRCSASSGYGINDTNTGTDIAWFIATILIFSAFALPIVLYRADVVSLLNRNEILFLKK